LLFLDTFSLLLVLVVPLSLLVEALSGAIIDDDALLPAINSTALGATSIDAAVIILRFLCETFFCF
jgi:hypothetical protein